MRLFLPLVCAVVAGLALSSASIAEDAFIIKSITVETKADAAGASPAVVEPAIAAEKTTLALKAPAPEAADLTPAVGTDPRKAEILRGSLFMMLVPHLCCR